MHEHEITSYQYFQHAVCYMWDWRLISLHILTNGVIALAYLVISLALVWIVRRRGLHLMNAAFLSYAAFIFLCGLGHAVEIVTLFYPWYWFAGYLNAATALVSIVVAALTMLNAPRIVRLPRAEAMRQAARWLDLRAQRLIDAPQRAENEEADASAKLHESARLLREIEEFLGQPGQLARRTEGV